MQRTTTSSRKGGFPKENAGGSARETAEVVALKALQFLAEDESAFAALCAASGLSHAEIRNRAADPEFLAAILDFLLEHEDRLIEFCAWAELPPETPARVRRALPGGESLEF